jgi:hypothetical protein
MDFQRNTGRYCAENGFSKKYREVLGGFAANEQLVISN